jgi:hypothetical protein
VARFAISADSPAENQASIISCKELQGALRDARRAANEKMIC